MADENGKLCEQLARWHAGRGCVSRTDEYLKLAEERGHYIPEGERTAIFVESRINGTKRHLESAEEHANAGRYCAVESLKDAERCAKEMREIVDDSEYKKLLDKIKSTEENVKKLLK